MSTADRPYGESGRLQRIAEGWGFRPQYGDRDDRHDHDIISYSKNGPFKTNEEALAFVQRRAAEGSKFHAKCLAYVVAERVR